MTEKELEEKTLELRDSIIELKRKRRVAGKDFYKAIDPYVKGILKRLEEREKKINRKQ